MGLVPLIIMLLLIFYTLAQVHCPTPSREAPRPGDTCDVSGRVLAMVGLGRPAGAPSAALGRRLGPSGCPLEPARAMHSVPREDDSDGYTLGA